MRRLALVFLLACAGCTAQSGAPTTSVTPELKTRIEHTIRAQYELPPDITIKIGDPKPSDIQGFQTLPIVLAGRGKEQKLDFMLSNDGKTLARMTKLDLTTDVYAERMKKIDTQGRPVRGNPNAKVTIVNYDDFECPFCSRMHETLMKEILPQYGDRIKIIYKDYPLPMHPWAKRAANDANCLAKESPEGFWQFADYVHGNQKQIGGGQDLAKSGAELDRLAMDFGAKNGANASSLQACIKSQPDAQLKSSMGEADSMGINATPTMFINGQRLEGAVDADDLRAVLNEQLQAAGVPPPAPLPSSNNAQTPVSK